MNNKTLVYTKFGSAEVLHFEERKRPIPVADQILVQVYATTVNRTDNATIRAIPFFARLITGIFKPKYPIPGSEFAGVVITCGENVRAFRPGDRVFGFHDLGAGCHAEYLAIADKYAQSIPEGISFEEAAASCEGAHYAFSCIKRLGLSAGDDAMIYGASGAIGSGAVQILKSMGLNVTAVSSTRHLELMKHIGADRIIDYTKTDFTQVDQKYDFIMDAVGKTSFFKVFHMLKHGGIFVSNDLGFLGINIMLPVITLILKPLLGFRKCNFPYPDDIPGSLALIRTLITEGKFKTVIDRVYPFSEIKDAYEYVNTERKTGNVVVRVQTGD